MLHYVSAYNLSQKICGIKLVAFQNSKTTKINATELHGNLHVHTVYTEGYIMLSTILAAASYCSKSHCEKLFYCLLKHYFCRHYSGWVCLLVALCMITGVEHIV